MTTDDRHEVPPAALARFTAGRATASERRAIARHLLAGCRTCRAGLHARGWVPGQAKQPARSAYDTAFARSLQRAEEELDRRRRRAAGARLLAALDTLPDTEQELKARNLVRFASPDLSAALVQRSHQVRYKDSDAMLRDARLAVATAEAAARRATAEETAVRDACARSWGQLGNAQRVRGSLVEAEAAFELAFEHLQAGTGDLALRGWLCRHLSSLRYFKRDFGTAAALAQEAATAFYTVGDLDGESSAVITLGIIRIYAGDPCGAIEPLLLGQGLAKGCGDEELFRAAAQGLIRAFIDLSLPRQAEALALRAERLFARCEDPLVLRRLDWQRGLIDRELGRLELAAIRLRHVRDSFAEVDLSYEVGVVSLDLVSVYVLQGRSVDALKTLGETVPLFQSLGVARELLASLAQLGGIVQEKEAALDLLRTITKQLGPGIPRDAA